MFSRFSILVAVVAAITAGARMERHIHVRQNSSQPSNGCNTGSISCCNSIQKASDFTFLLDDLSVPYDMADNVGINCSPVNIYGAGEAAACQQQPVCCSGNSYKGIINVGCSPFDLN